MGAGNTKVTNHRKGFVDEIEKVSKLDDSTFFNWFNESGGDINTNFLKGQCEFALFILLPILRLLDEPKKKVALEIGYGGGRLLAAACQSFKEVVGVDVHGHASKVERELNRRGIENFRLLQNDGKALPVEDSSIDLVYSFIVLQHVEKIDIFDSYMLEAYRSLNQGGYAVLFFARLSRYSVNRKSKFLYQVDRLAERLSRKGYREILARVNCVNLTISLKYAKKRAKEAGFSIVSEGVSKKIPLLQKYGGQHYLVLRKE